MISDPRPYLAQLGVPVHEATSPGYGYSGSYTPECVFLHWTASAPGSNTAASVVAGKHYHSCVARDGVCALGGWQVRQGHGGEGRTAPMSLARRGEMTLADIRHWQGSGAGDDTSSQPNQYGASVCIDNSGVGEVPPETQYRNWVATAAAFAVSIGRHSAGHVIDHASSTNRKVDITAVVGALDPARWLADIGTYIALLTNGPEDPIVAQTAVAMTPTKTGRGYWILANDGGVFSYGDANYAGGIIKADGSKLTQSPPVDIVADPDGRGYWVLVADGGVFSFDAPFWGSAVDDIH